MRFEDDVVLVVAEHHACVVLADEFGVRIRQNSDIRPWMGGQSGEWGIVLLRLFFILAGVEADMRSAGLKIRMSIFLFQNTCSKRYNFKNFIAFIKKS